MAKMNRDTQERLNRLRDAGIDYFIDLTEVDESRSYRGCYQAESLFALCDTDTEVPKDVAQMQELQSRIRTALTLGRRIYIHCRAELDGRGR